MKFDINLENRSQNDFKKQINKIKNKDRINVNFNSNFIFFISYFFNFIKRNKNIIKINFIYLDKLDILIKNLARKFFLENSLIKYKNRINFINFSTKTLFEILDVKNFLIFNKKKIFFLNRKIQLKLIFFHLNYIFYKNFRFFLKNFFFLDFSYFIFTDEKLKRFIYGFYFYPKDTRNILFKFMSLNNLHDNILKKLVYEQKSFDIIERIGFSVKFYLKNYKRYTIYFSFINCNTNKILDFLKKLDIDLFCNLNKSPKWLGIDYYNDYKNYKLYYTHVFREKLENIEIMKLFINKSCTKVIKYSQNKLYFKYEFNILEFNKIEKETLIKFKFKINVNTISFYVENNKIIKKINYKF